MFLIAILAAASVPDACAQEANNELAVFERHLEQAQQFKMVSRYGDTIDELQQARALAQDSDREDWYMEATIQLAEVLRASFKFDEGLELLRSLKGTSDYPKLHVRKLGRIAAIYAQGFEQNSVLRHDSLPTILSRAILLAVQNGLLAEEASLRNELGFYQSRSGAYDIGLTNLQQSANLFLQVGDSINWAGAVINIADLYVNKMQMDKVDSIGPPLYKIVRARNWHAMGTRLCAVIAARYYNMGDTMKYSHWSALAGGHTVEEFRAQFDSKVAAFDVIHNKAKVEAALRQRDSELNEQKLRSRELYAYLTGLLVVVLAVVLLWWRERSLKSKLNHTVGQLNQANEAYHMLILESNHRIKNNLQMITSMLRYTKRNSDPKQHQLVDNLSAKVQTISALHKHLYVEIHNELTPVDAYFEEVIAMYQEITTENLRVALDVGDIAIRSERMVYFGLVFNELLSNTIEHSPKSVQQIRMQIRPLSNHSYEFWYSDGSTILSDAEPQIGTGVTLIQQLIKRVGGTNYEWNMAAGSTRFEFEAGTAGKQPHPLLG